MKPACTRAMLLVDASASGLGKADRIWLEAHLADCATCTERASALERMGSALRDADWSLKPRQREAAIERALRAPAQRDPAKPLPHRRTLVLAFAAALAAGLLLWLATPKAGPPLSSAALVLRSANERSLSASTPSAPRPPVDEPPCDPPSQNAELASGSRLDVGSARVDVLAASRLCWKRGAATLALDAGSVRVNVTPGTPSGFRVATPRFVVEVIGTAFEVDTEGVEVLHGNVRVVAPEGGEQMALLGAGQSWSLRPAKTSAIAPGVISERLARARRDLAAGKVAVAREQLRGILREPIEPLQRAEARSLLAECALVEGKYDEAARAYGAVAGTHSSTLTGETALFAQARAEMRAGKHDAARATLQKYLSRYPNGRFHKEARSRLQSLHGK